MVGSLPCPVQGKACGLGRRQGVVRVSSAWGQVVGVEGEEALMPGWPGAGPSAWGPGL